LAGDPNGGQRPIRAAQIGGDGFQQIVFRGRKHLPQGAIVLFDESLEGVGLDEVLAGRRGLGVRNKPRSDVVSDRFPQSFAGGWIVRGFCDEFTHRADRILAGEDATYDLDDVVGVTGFE
jgi:hypothetical protein